MAINGLSDNHSSYTLYPGNVETLWAWRPYVSSGMKRIGDGEGKKEIKVNSSLVKIH